MAKITKIFISGKIANLISYERNGTPCVRTMPEEVKQTKATIRSAQNFGKAVRIAKFMRWGLESVIPPIKGRYVEYRMNDAVAQWLTSVKPGKNNTESDLSELCPLGFNKGIALSSVIKCPLEADWTPNGIVTLQLPAIIPNKNIKAPSHTRQLHWAITITGSMINKPESVGSYTASFDMDYNDTPLPAQSIALPFRLRHGSINVIGLSVQYSAIRKGKKKRIMDDGWLPAGIISALHYK